MTASTSKRSAIEPAWPISFSDEMVRAILKGRKSQTRRSNFGKWSARKKGDVLYVREWWAMNAAGKVFYRASCEQEDQVELATLKWCQPRHMPKAISRIWLRLTDDVRIERLQEISEEDAKAEGVEPWGICTWKDYAENGVTHVVLSAEDSFRSLWDSIHGPGSWDENPKVAVIPFEREWSW